MTQCACFVAGAKTKVSRQELALPRGHMSVVQDAGVRAQWLQCIVTQLKRLHPSP